jgi:hypothetical protein
MPETTIGSDATIIDVLPTLSEPVEYVRAVVGTMSACQEKNGNARVHIGITGEGKMPYHKIVFIDHHGSEQVYGAFSGGHPFKDIKIHENTWSSGSMTLEEVRGLLGRLRGWKGKKV